MGAFFNNEQKSGLKHEENKQKFIGTVSGRRLLWDEEKDILALNDNTFDFPANKLTMSREKGQESLKIESGTNKSNGSIIEMKNEKNLEIGMLSGGALVAKIIFDSKSKKITIESDDLVEIKSQKKITMEAPEIEIKAQKKLTLESTAEVGMKGANVKIAADVQLEAKGTNATFEGSAMAEFKGGAMAVLKGAIVMIN
jgi:phage gp45-like